MTSQQLCDSEGDCLDIQLAPHARGANKPGVWLTATSTDHTNADCHATVGPLDPAEVVRVIHQLVSQHHPGYLADGGNVEPDPTDLNDMDDDGEPLPEGTDLNDLTPGTLTRPATAEEPRLWAGADEPIIDTLIGSVADARAKADAAYMTADAALREASEEPGMTHESLSDYWARRMEVARQAFKAVPSTGQNGGLAEAFAGKGGQPRSVTDVLKVARFVADGERDIPGVDR